jgi:2,3-diaminopropionate biosynthesis protein SbnB
MHSQNEILLIKGHEVSALLRGRELEIVESVRRAYQAHARQQTSLPHSTFLRFPAQEKNRVIALPAYLGDSFDVAGIKWIASFPNNIQQQMDRASAVIILNSTQTGRPEAIIEGSIVSAKRTAAGAALAAQQLHSDHGDGIFGLIGTGPINFEIARFLLAARRELDSCIAFDLDETRGQQFVKNFETEFPDCAIKLAGRLDDVLWNCSLVSIATNAAHPHVANLSMCAPGTTILHISLRDLEPELILNCDNVLDDIDHVCRAQTSVHLAEQIAGHRDFLRCTLGEILNGEAPPRRTADDVVIFSPFGLGILDLAVSSLVCDLAGSSHKGTVIESFLPDSVVQVV